MARFRIWCERFIKGADYYLAIQHIYDNPWTFRKQDRNEQQYIKKNSSKKHGDNDKIATMRANLKDRVLIHQQKLQVSDMRTSIGKEMSSWQCNGKNKYNS